MERQPNTEYVLSLSYGKDSIACLEAIHQLGYTLNHIVHAEVWATDTIPADLPPMVEFKKYADQVIKFRYGIDVEHIHAVDKNGEKLTYEKIFYTQISKPRKKNSIQLYGFPQIRGPWCNSKLKMAALNAVKKKYGDCTSYIGIAADEPLRIERHKDNNILPLLDIGWNEDYCRQWCEDNSLLAPTYSDSLRGGCWFCHNQSVGQLRLLRKKYPEYWQLLLKWDNDSPVTFKPDGHTVHDFEKRFAAEDSGLIVPGDSRFRWKQVL